MEREKKKPKNFFFGDDKVFDPVGFHTNYFFVFTNYFFVFTDLFSFTDFLLLHCFTRQIVVG